MNDPGLESSNAKDTDERFLAFTLCQRQYALPLLRVKEVLALPDITPVPQCPPDIKGIMNLRGQVLTVVDLRSKLRMPQTETTRETVVIILDLGAIMAGIIVDTADEVFAVSSSDLRLPPEIGTQGRSEWIQSVTERNEGLVLVLNIDRIINVRDISSIQGQTTFSEERAG